MLISLCRANSRQARFVSRTTPLSSIMAMWADSEFRIVRANCWVYFIIFSAFFKSITSSQLLKKSCAILPYSRCGIKTIFIPRHVFNLTCLPLHIAILLTVYFRGNASGRFRSWIYLTHARSNHSSFPQIRLLLLPGVCRIIEIFSWIEANVGKLPEAYSRYSRDNFPEFKKIQVKKRPSLTTSPDFAD